MSLMTMKKLLTTITLLCFSVVGNAQDDNYDISELTLKNFQQVIPDNASISAYERMERERMDVNGTLYGTVENLSNERLFSCMMLFANSTYCQCLADKLPVFLSFTEFVILTTTTGLELADYFNESGENRQMFNRVREVREECINEKRIQEEQ